MIDTQNVHFSRSSPPYLSFLDSIHLSLFKGRCYFRKFGRQEDWDEPLPRHLDDEIVEWQKDLKKLSTIQIPRYSQIPEETKITYHMFSDASEKPYGSVDYQQSFHISGMVSTQLVLSKSRFTPLKKTNTPRLELLSASLGIKLGKKIIDVYEINMEKVKF